MNHVLNDRGETVIAEGAPGSIARARCEHPELIKSLGGHSKSKDATAVAEQLHKRGILSPLEATSTLLAAGFTDQEAKGVYRQLQVLIDDQNRTVVGVRPAPKGPGIEHSPGGMAPGL